MPDVKERAATEMQAAWLVCSERESWRQIAHLN